MLAIEEEVDGVDAVEVTLLERLGGYACIAMVCPGVLEPEDLGSYGVDVPVGALSKECVREGGDCERESGRGFSIS